MKRSEQINELAAALAKAQPAFEAAGRDHKARVETRTGGSYEFSYADFAAYLDVCRKPLGDNGLSFVQEATRTEDSVSVVTLLMHSSGQWIESDPLSVPLIADSRGAITAQIIGSGVTYGKRYSLSSLIGLASESDDDGNAASGNDANISKREPIPACPSCGKQTSVIVGKAEFGGGLVCFKGKQGCGHKWATEKYPAAGDKKPDPPKQEPKKEAPKSDAPVGGCAEYEQLAKFLKEIGCTKPEQATACVRLTGNDFTIGELRNLPQDCLRILTELEGVSDKGAILKQATAAA